MNGLPTTLHEPLAEALSSTGDRSPVRAVAPLGGGCINNAQRLQTDQGVYFLKWNPDPLPGLFAKEAHGLELMAQTRTVRVPQVIAYGEAGADCPAYILMEWLEGPADGDMARLGEQLAEMHRQSCSPQDPPAYGLDEDNYLGFVQQLNHWETDWATFFAEWRMRPQVELAQASGKLPVDRRRRLDRFIARLPELLGGVERRPCLLHGDLWGGNIIPAADGLALIDPAVSYSDREIEISYTEMFGSLDPRFYAGYNAVWPLDPGYAERRDLHNLYHLVNHLNHFGESYGPHVDAALRRYT